MNAVEFLKLRRRYCKESGWNPNIPDGSSPYADDETIERYVARVEQWGREHPKETRQSKFLKLFPDAPIVDGRILVCPKIIANGFKPNCDKIDCYKCREKYWKEETDL